MRFHATRPTETGLEMHLVSVHKLVQDFQPRVVILDPITNYLRRAPGTMPPSMALRLIDFLKARQITAVLNSLVNRHDSTEAAVLSISSLIDTWILLRDVELGGERNRALDILKSRGMAHSNQLREYLLTNYGVDLLDAYLGPDGVLTGSMRLSQEARERAPRPWRSGKIWSESGESSSASTRRSSHR